MNTLCSKCLALADAILRLMPCEVQYRIQVVQPTALATSCYPECMANGMQERQATERLNVQTNVRWQAAVRMEGSWPGMHSDCPWKLANANRQLPASSERVLPASSTRSCSEAVHAPQLLHQRFNLCHRLGARQLQLHLPLHAGPPQQRQEHLG